MESEERDVDLEAEATETPDEFAEEVENDPSADPDDPDLKRIQGG
jgi:hypothetical protein